MANSERRRASSTNLEVWGVVLALGVLVAFCATFVPALLPRPAAPESAAEGPGDPRATYRAEQGVQAFHAGHWYPAHVHSASAGRYFITYDDFSISWHEWVSASRLKKR